MADSLEATIDLYGEFPVIIVSYVIVEAGGNLEAKTIGFHSSAIGLR